jgi:uncharacterized protein (TIGR02246 family)
MQRHMAISSFLIILAAASVASSAETKPAQPQDEKVLAVGHAGKEGSRCGEVIAEFEKCFNGGDAKGLAALWKPDGYFQGPQGERLFGRKDIEAAFEKFFAANKGCKLQIDVIGGRSVTDDVAVIDAIVDVTPARDGAGGEPHATIVFVLRDGHWLIDSIRETATAAAHCPTQLKDLAWMVGDWTGALGGSPNFSMRSTCDWTANRSFLIRKFSVTGKDVMFPGGTEVIGWDPRARRIRSWIFEANGGFGESVWTRNGDCWTVKYNGVLADGSDVSATHVLTHVDADTLTLQSTDRLVDGQKRPDVAKVTIKRSPAKEESRAKPSPLTNPPRQVLP